MPFAKGAVDSPGWKKVFRLYVGLWGTMLLVDNSKYKSMSLDDFYRGRSILKRYNV